MSGTNSARGLVRMHTRTTWGKAQFKRPRYRWWDNKADGAELGYEEMVWIRLSQNRASDGVFTSRQWNFGFRRRWGISWQFKRFLAIQGHWSLLLYILRWFHNSDSTAGGYIGSNEISGLAWMVSRYGFRQSWPISVSYSGISSSELIEITIYFFFSRLAKNLV
jgi:hypothetical protein